MALGRVGSNIKIRSVASSSTSTNAITVIGCACCVQPCETYPAFMPWTADSVNLPVAIDFYGTTLQKNGTGYGNSTNGVNLEGEKWAVYRNGTRTEEDYLLSGGRNDFFADEYTAIFPSWTLGTSYTVLVTRVSECSWNGQFQIAHCINPGVASLVLDDDGWSFRAGGFSGPNSLCFGFATVKHPAPQSSPIGQWNGGLSIS
jgi:hypothetical protein